VVHDQCVPEEQSHADNAHCVKVSIAEGLDTGYAVLKDHDPSKPYEYLLIPTKRISGIEDPAVLAPTAPNYFAAAWAERLFVASILKHDLAWDEVGLAVNSARDRSQDQLHIHIDCIRPDVRAALRSNSFEPGSWSELKLPPPDHNYQVLKLGDWSIGGASPFQLVSKEAIRARINMELATIVVAGGIFSDGSRGFYLLTSYRTDAVPAHGEDLLDPECHSPADAK
jgi:CDP-diacylglycerol pyrophosphatase